MARARRGFVLLLLGAALAILAAGCGGGGSGSSSSNDANGGFTPYEVKMQALGNTLASSLLVTGTANRTATNGQIVRNLRKAQTALRTAAAQLAQITPPAAAKPGHELLEKGVREYADEIDGLIAGLKKGNRDAIFAVTSLKGVKDMTRGTHDISKAGYIIVLGG
jgi:hypothetical protein